MNKSERERLASIASEMKTSFNSTPEVVMWGERLLAEFPCVSKLVEQYDDVQKIENIASSYTSYIIEMSTSYSGLSGSDQHINKLGIGGRESLYHVFDDYFCHDNALNLCDIEDSLGSVSTEAKTMIKTLLSDAVFIETICNSEDLTHEQKCLYKGQYLSDDWR